VVILLMNFEDVRKFDVGGAVSRYVADLTRSKKMLIYQCVAIILKLFSATRSTRRMYRWLGNWIGQSRRKKRFNTTYIERGKWLLDRLTEFGLNLSPSSHVLELGTGWMHFYAVFLRLFSTTQITVFDVIDNRQLSALQWTFNKLPGYLKKYFLLNEKKASLIQLLTNQIASVSSFEELYKLLEFTYRINPAGDLSSFEDNGFDLVFSFDVLEHIQHDDIIDSIGSYYRVLKPGGYLIHQIGLDDHLAHYDCRASRKQFLTYSESEWKFRFENQVPYSEFLTLFENRGFEQVHASVLREPESVIDLSIAKQYQNLSLEDLEATRAFLVYRKSAAK